MLVFLDELCIVKCPCGLQNTWVDIICNAHLTIHLFHVLFVVVFLCMNLLRNNHRDTLATIQSAPRNNSNQPQHTKTSDRIHRLIVLTQHISS